MFQSAGSTSTSNGGWPIANVYFLGFGQGGSMALELAINYQRNGRPLGLGGVISLSGFLSSFEKSNQASTSDVLITYGSDEDVPESLLERHRSVLSSRLELCKVTGKSQEMPKSPAEMRKIMEFFGARLALRNLAMESSADIIELTNE